LNYDLIVYLTTEGDLAVVSAGNRFRQGDKHVEIVAFSHEREVRLMTVNGDELGPIIPLRSVLDATVDAEPVEYDTFRARQAQLLKQYEDGETERERQDKQTKMAKDLLETEAKLRTANAALVLSTSREKTSKEALAQTKKELATAKEKIKELNTSKRDLKSIADLTADNDKLRADLAAARRDLDASRQDAVLLRNYVEQSNKRQRISEQGDYRSVTTVPPPIRGLNLDHLNERTPLKSLSMQW
jgi:chromosome segregation ATPase